MATRPGPRVGVPFFELSGLPDEIHDAGGEPVPLLLPTARPEGGVALAREWFADLATISCASTNLDALFAYGGDDIERGELLGLLLAGLRLNLPAVVAGPPGDVQLRAALVTLGLAPLEADPAEAVVEAARGGPRTTDLVESFSLANALRVGCSLGGDPEMIVHLAALAREAGVAGFGQMIRVLVPETPLVVNPDSAWFAEHDLAGLLAHLGDALHDTQTVTGPLRDVSTTDTSPPAPPGSSRPRLTFARGRASGTEILCQAPRSSAEEVAGECYVYRTEEAAVRAVEGGFVWPGSFLVVGGHGPRGGPGLRRLKRLGHALDEHGEAASISVITDGLPPAKADGNWFSLFSPEAASGGVIGRLRDGDTLRIDLADGRIRTGVGAGELENRRPWRFDATAGRGYAARGYAARYARSALPGLEGAGFG